MKKGKIREINFDLNSKICPSNAYRKIKNFMKNNGFSHRLWSGYISKQPMTNTEVASLNEKLWAALPWLKECANVIDCTTAENRFDLIQLHREQTARMFSDNPYMEICQLEGKIKERIMKNNDNDTEVANNTIKELQAEIDFSSCLIVLAKLICPNCDLLACLWNDHYTVISRRVSEINWISSAGVQ